MPESELLTREFEIRLTEDTDAREVEGIAVPYGQIIAMRDWDHDTDYERFEVGSVEPHPDGHLYFSEHRKAIGKVVAGRDTPEGHVIRAAISRTPAGDEVYTLIKDEVLTKHSIGFYPVDSRIDLMRLTEDGPEIRVLTRTKVYVRETSAVAFPAYSGANISAVRSQNQSEKDTPMDTDTLTRADLDQVNDQVETLNRQLAVIAAGGTTPPAANVLAEYRSHGEFLKALSSGQAREHVDALNRAYTGSVVGDASAGVPPTWIDRDVRLVETRRPIVNLFNREALPAEGLTVNYPTFASKSGDVAKQAAEGDPLGLMKLVFGTGSAPVSTEGGAVELTKQLIDRMPASYLSKVLQMVKISYGKRTNNIVRAALIGIPTTGAGSSNSVLDISAGITAAALTGAMVDAADAIEENSLGLGLDFVLCSKNQFKQVASLTDTTGRPLFSVSASTGGAVNVLGGVNIKSLTLDVEGVPWILDPGMAANAHARACSSEALTILESPGAPFQLTDENIINLTEAFSLYGYISTTVDDPKGIVPIKMA